MIAEEPGSRFILRRKGAGVSIAKRGVGSRHFCMRMIAATLFAVTLVAGATGAETEGCSASKLRHCLPPNHTPPVSAMIVDQIADCVCGTKSKCKEMESCAEARCFLEKCGVTRLDGDGDGVPCEAICG